LVERLEVLVIARRLADENLLARKVIHGIDGRAIGTRHDNLGNVAVHRVGEINQFLPLGGDGKVSEDEVAVAIDELGDEFLAADGNEDDAHLRLPVFRFLVERLFKEGEHVVGNPAAASVFDIEECLRIRHQRPDDPVLRGVEVALELGLG